MTMQLAIHSNLKQVVEHVERFTGQLPGYVLKLVEPKPWLAVARREAEQVLRALAKDPDEEALVPKFVEAVTTEVFSATAMEWSLENVREQAVQVLQAMQLDQFGPLTQWADRAQANRLAALIELWVATPVEQGGKRRDERDAGKSDAEIARGLVMIFFGPRSEGRNAASLALLPHIQAFAERQAARAGGLSPERVMLWLEAVLGAWRDVILQDLPPMMKAQIRRCWGTTK